MTAVRGWPIEHTLTALDSLGRPVPVSTGVTANYNGRPVAVFAVGTGEACDACGLTPPSVELTSGLLDRLWRAMHTAIAASWQVRREHPGDNR
ncbi:hypothetical protein [Amycolatopsis solani]|uniref:hypothetical protein n=1 Tax=Amycolatopsis solani TaxID=3028615 RepID=UPI0025B19DAC|nr:hypothetical protein [Amycolatopsis sp. MEP2-6]